jgi:hypothetical protein
VIRAGQRSGGELQLDGLRHLCIAAVRQREQSVRGAALGQANVDRHDAGAGGNDDLTPDSGVVGRARLNRVRAFVERAGVAAMNGIEDCGLRIEDCDDGGFEGAAVRGVVNRAGDVAVAAAERRIAAENERLREVGGERRAGGVLRALRHRERDRLLRHVRKRNRRDVVGRVHREGAGERALPFRHDEDRAARAGDERGRIHRLRELDGERLRRAIERCALDLRHGAVDAEAERALGGERAVGADLAHAHEVIAGLAGERECEFECAGLRGDGGHRHAIDVQAHARSGIRRPAGDRGAAEAAAGCRFVDDRRAGRRGRGNRKAEGVRGRDR